MFMLPVIVLSIIMGFSVLIGIFIAFKYKINYKTLALLVGFIVGIFGGVIFFKLFPLWRGFYYLLSHLPWFLVGIFVFWFIDRAVLGQLFLRNHSKMNISLILIIAIILDDLAEGFTLAVTGLFSLALILIFFFVVFIQNIIEGIVEGYEELEDEWSKKQIIYLNLSAAIAPVISASLGLFMFNEINKTHLNISLAFLAGALFYLNFFDLARKLEWNAREIIGCIFGILLLMIISIIV
ncbi:ZIP family metal transporter [[Eubacterium] cellulosolvens]